MIDTVTSSKSDRTPPLLTAPEVAAILQVTPRTVWRWAAAGRLPRVRINGITRYRASDIAALIGPVNDDDLARNEAAVKKPGRGASHDGS